MRPAPGGAQDVPTLLESIESGITEATGHYEALVVENRTLKAALRACLTYIEQQPRPWVAWPVRAYRYLVAR